MLNFTKPNFSLLCVSVMLVFSLISPPSYAQRKPSIMLKRPTYRLGEFQLNYAHNFSPNGKIFVFSCNGAVRLWQTETGKELRAFDQHKYIYDGGIVENKEGPFSAVFSPDGKTLTSVSDRVRIWNTKTWRVAKTLNVQGQPRYSSPISVFYSPDSQTLAVSGNTVSLWNVASGKKLKILKRKETIEMLGFWQDGQEILVQREGIKHLDSWEWKTDMFRSIKNIKVEATQSQSYVISHRGRFIAVCIRPQGRNKEELHVYDFSSKRIKIIKNQQVAVHLAVSADGKTLAAGDDLGVKIYETNTWREIYQIDTKLGVFNLVLSPDGTWLGMGNALKDVTLWKLPKR